MRRHFPRVRYQMVVQRCPSRRTRKKIHSAVREEEPTMAMDFLGIKESKIGTLVLSNVCFISRPKTKYQIHSVRN